MECKTANDLLPLYFDGELDRSTNREFEAHLDECPECRATLIGLDTLRRTLRDQMPRYPAPQALRQRIEQTTARSANRRPTRSRREWLALAASWVLAFAAGGVAMTIRNAPSRGDETAMSDGAAQIQRDLFASHWRALAAASPVDVVSTDRHTVKPWFEGKVAQAPLVQDFADQGFALVGGRIDYVGTARVPVLVYRHGRHLIDVFVLPDGTPSPIGTKTVQSGYRLDAIRLGDQPAAVVSDMDQGELMRFVGLLGIAN